MTAIVIDGKRIANKVRTALRGRIEALVKRGIQPGLAVVLIGNNPASKVYVSNKVRACAELGIHSEIYTLPESVTSEAVVARLLLLNVNPRIHGVIVQLPLPTHIKLRTVQEAIDIAKDVDGFHLYNVGGLIIGDMVFPPCTPYGVQMLLEMEGIPIEGQNVVVVGASNIVGKPMAMMLLQKDATVSICHVKTRELAQYTILADILIVAAGRPNLIVPEMVKRGAVVIDVGINRLSNGTLVGDVAFEAVRHKASYITPVPGGVGPMTVTMLLENTVRAAERISSNCLSGATSQIE